MTVTKGEIQTGKSRTFYNRSGEGRAEMVLLLHGSGPGVSAWSNWQYALPFFDDQFDQEQI